MTHDSPADAASLRRQLAEMEENLRLIEERQSKYVMGVDVPLQLEKQERVLRREIAARKARLAGAKATPAKQPSVTPSRESLPNPFTDVVAIRDRDRFVGREAALERLLRLLEGGSVAIVGARKVGKTSLLHRLADLLRREPEQIVIFWDFHDPGKMKHLLAQVIEALGSDGKKWDDFKRAVRGRRVVLLLDEFDLAPERGFDLDTLRGFRALCQLERGLRLATASRPLPKEFFSTQVGSWPYDFLSPQPLGPFSPDEARRLLAHPWLPNAPHFDAPTGEELIALSGCHPYRLQRAAHHRYEALHDPTYNWRAAYNLDLEALQ